MNRDYQHEATERLKELNCLYAIVFLLTEPQPTVERVIKCIVSGIKAACVDPSRTIVWVEYQASIYPSDHQLLGDPLVTASLEVGGEVRGRVCVQTTADGGILPEERRLVKAVVEVAGAVIDRIELRTRTENALSEVARKNVALTELLEQHRSYERCSATRLRTVVDETVVPVVQRLQQEITTSAPFLTEYLSPLLNAVRALSDREAGPSRLETYRLSEREMEVAALIRGGCSTKEIARLLHVEPVTIETHRYRIRKKLGIQKSDVRLSVYLKKFAHGGEKNT